MKAVSGPFFLMQAVVQSNGLALGKRVTFTKDDFVGFLTAVVNEGKYFASKGMVHHRGRTTTVMAAEIKDVAHDAFVLLKKKKIEQAVIEIEWPVKKPGRAVLFILIYGGVIMPVYVDQRGRLDCCGRVFVDSAGDVCLINHWPDKAAQTSRSHLHHAVLAVVEVVTKEKALPAAPGRKAKKQLPLF